MDGAERLRKMINHSLDTLNVTRGELLNVLDELDSVLLKRRVRASQCCDKETKVRSSCSVIDAASTSTCGDVQLWFDWAKDDQ
jgi:hypothetical protein